MRTETIDIHAQTSGECRRWPGPCRHELCRYHMAHVGQGSWESRKPVITHEACSLDAAERGPLTLAEVAERLGISRERVRQLERYALRKLEKKYGTELLEALAERIASAPAGYVYPDAFEAKPRRRNYGIKRPCSW